MVPVAVIGVEAGVEGVVRDGPKRHVRRVQEGGVLRVGHKAARRLQTEEGPEASAVQVEVLPVLASEEDVVPVGLSGPEGSGSNVP